MANTAGPQQVLDAARGAVQRLGSVVSPSGVRGSRDEWAAAVGELQRVIDVASAAQDAAMVRLAAIEGQWCEDGTVVEAHKALGHVALDAPAIVSGVLNVSSVHAERRVRQAVRLAADGPEGTPSATGLGGLHTAMAAGRLDAYRALVVAEELQECPAEVAATVVASLDQWFGVEDAPRLRRRARRLLARVSPDLLRQRAVRARSESALRRWVDEPGVDTWHGTFPSEEACRAWAAVDALAQQYLTDGVCARIDRARAQALTDLVTGQATIEVQVVLTTPTSLTTPATPASLNTPAIAARTGATAPVGDRDLVEVAGASTPGGDRDRDLVEVTGPAAGEPALVPRGWLDDAIRSSTTARDRLGRARVVPCDPATGALADPGDALATSAYRPGPQLAALVRARDGHCRFPGCHVTARCCDLDHVTPWPTGPTTAANLACLCRRHHRTKQLPGWQARLHPDATMTWTDPTGHHRTTHPADRLHPLHLPDTGHDPDPPPPGIPSLALPD